MSYLCTYSLYFDKNSRNGCALCTLAPLEKNE
jgi:hypothetical protein